MKSDLQALMEARDLDALLITGDAFHNPAMVYFTGVAHVSDGILLLRRGEEPLLFANPMERDEAAATGLATRNLNEFNYTQLYEQSGKDPLLATARLWQLLLQDMELTRGRIAVYGQRDAGEIFGLLSALEELLPQIEFVGEFRDTVLLAARATKDADEIAQMRSVGQRTVKVVHRLADYLASQKEKDGVLVDEDDQPVTVGVVKGMLNLWLAEQGLENPHGTIFAPGAEGGVPHSAGSADAPIKLGEPIVFDIFPCDAGGGYFFDFTRTWCIGHASPEAQALYDDVRHVYDTIMGELEADTPCTQYQTRTCELFAAQGHPTVAEDPTTEVGFVHGLAHGLGLDIHEAPRFSRDASEKDILRVGSVVTIEPGLYYPARGLGCRIEDAVVITEKGLEVLAPYALDLVIPLKG